MAPSACPAFTTAVWPGQYSHTSIKDGTAGSYRSRPSLSIWSYTSLGNLPHRRDADVGAGLFLLARERRPLVGGVPRAPRQIGPADESRPHRCQDPGTGPVVRFTAAGFTDSRHPLIITGPRRPGKPNQGEGESRVGRNALDGVVRATRAHRQRLLHLTDPQGLAQIHQVWPAYPGDESS